MKMVPDCQGLVHGFVKLVFDWENRAENRGGIPEPGGFVQTVRYYPDCKVLSRLIQTGIGFELAVGFHISRQVKGVVFSIDF